MRTISLITAWTPLCFRSREMKKMGARVSDALETAKAYLMVMIFTAILDFITENPLICWLFGKNAQASKAV